MSTLKLEILIYFQVRMAGNPDAVSKFLSGLAVKLQPLWKEEKAEMLKLKEEEVTIREPGGWGEGLKAPPSPKHCRKVQF